MRSVTQPLLEPRRPESAGRSQLRIVVDRSRCTGIGICESLAEDHFEVGDDGELTVTGGENVLPEDLSRVQEAVDGCPARALRLEAL